MGTNIRNLREGDLVRRTKSARKVDGFNDDSFKQGKYRIISISHNEVNIKNTLVFEGCNHTLDLRIWEDNWELIDEGDILITVQASGEKLVIDGEDIDELKRVLGMLTKKYNCKAVIKDFHISYKEFKIN